MRALCLLAALAALMSAAPAGAEPKPLYIHTGMVVDPPDGWPSFCERYLLEECLFYDPDPKDIPFTQANWHLLMQVNQGVNLQIKPMTDLEHYGEVEWWEYPTDGFGDCEDYVLLKRKMLIDAGLPRSALLITTVLDWKKQGHAVLTVVTDKGEWILDNQNQAIMLWYKTGYEFHTRQSREDPNVWIDLPRFKHPLVVSTSKR